MKRSMFVLAALLGATALSGCWAEETKTFGPNNHFVVVSKNDAWGTTHIATYDRETGHVSVDNLRSDALGQIATAVVPAAVNAFAATVVANDICSDGCGESRIDFGSVASSAFASSSSTFVESGSSISTSAGGDWTKITTCIGCEESFGDTLTESWSQHNDNIVDTQDDGATYGVWRYTLALIALLLVGGRVMQIIDGSIAREDERKPAKTKQPRPMRREKDGLVWVRKKDDACPYCRGHAEADGDCGCGATQFFFVKPTTETVVTNVPAFA